MARPPKGKPLTLRPIRLDDDVWAECQRLGKEHGTINEGLRGVLSISCGDEGGGGSPSRPTVSPVKQNQTGDESGKPVRVSTLGNQPAAKPFNGPLLKPSEKKK